ncbi:hypothetical protein CC78DRAFT_618549 [Lojkania enalia]|uniref:Uncharacterized protein n=1 Tax=Lojkania enalia TaxID=147567 RepID=A0A9P4K958_9PLEO|nr:hypothetical protein CC78DRAFT_618549 [Didymosphaeria enalia]
MRLFALTGVVLTGLVSLAAGIPLYERADTDVHLDDTSLATHATDCTYMHTKCDTDRKTVLMCNAAHEYELYQRCPEPKCCRYGLHGYPDCYSQCDPNLPPLDENVAFTTRRTTPVARGDADDLAIREEPFRFVKYDNTPTLDATLAAFIESAGPLLKRQGSGQEAYKPGTYKCFGEKSMVLLCDAYGKWVKSANCKDYGDCREGPTPGTAYRIGHLEKRQRTPGTYKYCENKLMAVVCSAQGHWHISANCKDYGDCREGSIPGTACCKGYHSKRDATALDSVTTPIYDSTIHLDGRQEPDIDCRPGTYGCNGAHTEVLVCSSDGKWTQSAQCRGSTCRAGPTPGTAYCLGHPERDATVLAPLDGPATPHEARQDWWETCQPGTYTCGRDNTAMLICGPKRIWMFSAECSGKTCVKGQISGTAYCQSKRDVTTADAILGAVEEANNLSKRLENTHCNPGKYSCSSGKYGVLMIMVCDHFGIWKLSTTCNRGQRCIYGPTPRTNFCAVKKHEAQQIIDKRNSGEHNCNNRLWLMVCSLLGTWTPSAKCFDLSCSGGSIPGAAQCSTNNRLDGRQGGDRGTLGDFICDKDKMKLYACGPSSQWTLSATCASGSYQEGVILGAAYYRREEDSAITPSVRRRNNVDQ